MKRLTNLLVFGLFFALTFVAFATVPKLINFQGILKTPADTVVSDGSYSVTFTIYNAPAGGINLWSETQSVTTTGGLFAVLLGASNPVPDTAFKGSQRWLGIAVSPDGEMPIRQQLVSVGYAYRVNSVDSASGGTITSKVSIGPGNINTGTNAFVAGANNRARGAYSVVGGGGGTLADSNSASGLGSTIGGGLRNIASGEVATVGGGAFNTASGDDATVAGGIANTANSGSTTVGGGFGNTANGGNATVSGGFGNTASGYDATVGGGEENTASGNLATVPGGGKNTATGNWSFAAGRYAKALHTGAFVWADAGDGSGVGGVDFASTANNQFNVRASGGTRIFSDSALTAGVTLAVGASAWAAVSDSMLKRNIRVLDGKEMLDKVMQLPIKRWSYKAQDAGIEHIGPMAQDFYPLFKVGDDEKTISTIDPPGIALAAIQGLYKIVQEQKAENEELHRKVVQVDELKAKNEELSAEMKELKALVQKLLAKNEGTLNQTYTLNNEQKGGVK